MFQAVLRSERNEYGKRIRKDYEAGRIKEHRAAMRKYPPRYDGISNTLTTVLKDNYVIECPICIAMRGRYNTDGSISQNLEPRYDGRTNTITTVQKDNLILVKSKFYSEGDKP